MKVVEAGQVVVKGRLRLPLVWRGCCTLLLLRHEAQCYIARAAGRDERRYLWI
jgi:hypothetical protein